MYDINGPCFAEYVRDQMEAQLRDSDQPPPPGVELSPSPRLQRMSGHGELWVDENGLPRRQVVDLEIPQLTQEYDARIHLVVNFDFGKATSQRVNESTSGRIGGMIENSIARIAPSDVLCLAVAFALSAALVASGRRWVYTVIAVTVSIIMVVMPLLQADGIARFQARLAEAAESTQSIAEALGVSDQLPVTSDQLSAISDQSPAPNGTQHAIRNTDHASRITFHASRASSSSNSTPSLYCSKGNTTDDTDNDGLSDAAENCLGTDPYHEDSDRDIITDTLEIDGFDYGGRHWTSDPFNPDSNQDGLTDFAEWPDPVGAAPDLDVANDWDPDGDGVPNLWDEDNDGDEVPDSIDLSPYARTTYSDTFSLNIQGGDFDGYLYVEMQVQPEDMSHLRYSTGYLDWPHDELGQLQDLDDSTEDIRLLPVFRIHTNQAPDRNLARNHGVIVFEEDGAYVLYITPMPVSDGGRIVAFSAMMAYRPDQLDDIRWEKVELVWMMQMSTDQQVGDEIKTSVTPLHSYLEESFRVTGLQITKSRNFEAAILGTPDSPGEDRLLFNLLFGLGSTFLTHKKPVLRAGPGEDSLETRFTNPNTPLEQTWGVTSTLVTMDLPATPYGHSDEGVADLQTRIRNFLDVEGYPTDGYASLVIATQSETGLYGLDDQGQFEPQAEFNLNLNNVSMSTMRGLKSNTYRYEDGAWVSLDLDETLNVMQERYEDELSDIVADLQANYPDLTEEDLQLLLDMFYTAWFVGQTRIISVDGQPLVSDSRSDGDVFDELNHDQDTLPAYLIEATHLGQPGGGLRVGDNQAQTYTYQREQDGKENTFGFIPTSVIMAGTAGVHVVRTILTTKTTLQAVKFAKATGSWTGRMRLAASKNAGAGSRWLGAIGAIVAGVAIWTMFFVTAYGTGWDWDSPTVKFAATYASVATVMVAILFAISLNPIGAIVVGILGLLDLLCFALTWLFTGEGFSFLDWVTRKIAEAFYSVDVLTKLGKMDFVNFDTALMDKELGLIVGNRFRISAQFVGEILAESEAEEEDVEDSWVDAAYHGRDTGVPWVNKTGGKDCSTSWWWDKTCRNDVAVEWQLDTVKRNFKLTAESSVEAKTFYQECTLGICDRKTQWIYLPGDLEDKGSWKAMDFYVDVLPDNVHELWNWSDIINPDPDGDGLSNDEEASLNTDPNNWDTDGDGLSDKFEFDSQDTLGTDPTKADTDGDGLSDGLEYRIGTKINAKDSDDDGLEDGEEVFHQTAAGDWVGGWLISLPGRAQPVGVFSDPLAADTDGDGLNDRSERSEEVSPYAFNDSPHLTLEGHPSAESPAGAAGVYVEPGDEVTMKLSLDNTGPRPITSTLTLCLPDFLTDVQGGDMRGDSTPPKQPAASCTGLQWSFANQHTLLEHEVVSTTITTTVASLSASASAEMTATLPYQMGDEEEDITDQVTVIVDVDDPEATITAPSDGAVLGGGISHYVIGGSASDETSWVTLVEVNLPNGGWVEAEGISPWAYTWELPDDGQYTLQGRARDYLKREGLSGEVNVTVDNTPPEVTLNLQDGEVVTGESTNVITITLEGTASDNLSGLTRVQVSTDGRPWREVWAEGGAPLSANWSTKWTLPNEETAQGRHTVNVRAFDRAGNRSDPLRRTIIVDVVPPTSELTDRSYLQDPPPYVLTNQQLDLYGVANDAGRVPQPARPAELVGDLDGLDDATIWLELSSVTDDDDGVSVAWIGDFNGDRLGDLVIGLPAAQGGKGQATIVYGRAGGWPTPMDAEVLADSPTSPVGKTGAGIGDAVAAAGDVNGDGFDDLLIGDATNDRVFLVFGQPGPLGRDVTLEGPRYPYWSVIDLTGLQDLSGLSTAGDVNGDGLDDLLIGTAGTEGKAYLLLGEANPWWETVPLDVKAAAVIATAAAGARLTGVGDMDGDQYDEFVVVDGNTVYLFEGRDSFAAGTGGPNETLTLADDAIATFNSSETRPEVAALGDVNGDDLADFIYADGDQPKVVFGNKDRNWTTQALNFTPAPSGFLAAPGDVDDDGLADILVGNADGDAYLILGKDLSEVKATLTDVQAAASTPYAAGADLNSDGSSDLLLVPAELGVSSVLDYGKPPHIDPDDLPVSASKTLRVLETLRVFQGVSHYVNDDGTCEGYTPCYTDIQDAVNAAGDGDTIEVQPGVYDSFTVDGVNNLTIAGVHADAVFVDGAGSAFAVKVQNATGVTLKKLTIRHGDDAIYLDHAGVGGYQDPAKKIALERVLIYDFASHAIAMDRISTARLTRCTLAGGDNHIYLYGDPDPAMDASWSTVSTDSRTATSADGGIFTDDKKVYFVDDSEQIDFYNPATNIWSSLVKPPKGLHAAVTADENGHLWALRRDPSTGFDGPVYAIAYVNANKIYVGGDFQHVGSVATPYIAQWDGSQWHAVTPDRGFRPNGPVYAILVDGKKIYAGGSFGLRYLPDPTQQQPFPSWENWGDISGGGAVYTMVFHSDGVFVGGDFDKIGGVTAHKIAKREANGEWRRIAHPPSDSCNGILSAGRHVSALVNKDGIVYLGGQFHEVGAEAQDSYGCVDPTEYGLAKTDGSYSYGYWISGPPKKSDLRQGSDIYTFAFYGNDMVVGGRFDNVNCYYKDGYYDGWWPNSSYCSASGAASNLAIFANKEWQVPGYLKANAPVRTLQVVGNQLYIGGDFTQVGGSTAAEHVAYYDSFPGGDGDWHALGGGVNGSVRALVHRDGHTYIGGTFTLAGGNAAFRFAHWNGSQWIGLSEQSFYEYVGGSWQARAVLPDFVGEGASIVSDGNGHLYAVPGSGSRELYRYTISSNTWEKKASLPGGLGAGGGLAWTDGYLFALRGGNTRDLYRYDPAEDKWVTRAPIPGAGPVVGVGGSLAWDGRDWLYVLAGGNGTGFLRYHVHADEWETLQNTSDVVNLGGGLARIGHNVYGVPGGGQELWSYDPIAIYPEKLTLDHVAVVVPETASTSAWINLNDLVVWPDDFVVGGADNTWVGRSGATWSPQPILDGSAQITHDAARLLDPDRDVYRVGTGTKLDGGYHTYRPDYTVEPCEGPECESPTPIQAGINSGANRVLLRPGTYKENFYLISGVEVIGDSADLTIVEPRAGSSAPALVRAEGVVGAKLSMLTLNGAGSGIDGLSAEDGARYVVVKQNIIRGTDTGIYVTGDDIELEVVNNTVVYNQDGMVASNCAPLDVRNTIFAHHTNTGLTYEGCAPRKLHKYNLYWSNGTDLSPNEPGAGELFLDPLFVSPGEPSHDYHTLDGSPVIDAGDPGDPPPPGAGARVDIGYIDQNRAGLYVDDDYCETCTNDGLSWQVDAFDHIQDALDKAADNIHDLKGLRYTVAVAAGTYTETLTVSSYVRLVGAGAEETIIDAHTISQTVVTFDGVVESEITGFTMRAFTNTTAISVSGASNAILITRNIIETWNETSTESAVAFSGRATGWVTFNTLVSHNGRRDFDTPEGHRDSGISSSGVGTWVAVENNIFSGLLSSRLFGECDEFYEGHFYGLHTLDHGQIFNSYNLLHNNLAYKDDAGTGLSEGPGDLRYHYPCFEYGTYRPEPASPARDAASPYADVPPGGGERADMGYYELTAAPAAVFLGREDVSSASGNSGVSQVEVGFSQVGDPGSAVTDTIPSTWTPVTLDMPEETVSYWQTSFTPTQESLYRFYSRAADVATNQEEDEEDWYDGAFVADSTPPVVTWTRPVRGIILNTPLELRAQVSDYAAGEFSVKDITFVVDGDEYQAEWAADPWDEGDPRSFRAWVDLAVGTYNNVFAVAEDRTGNQGQSDPVGFTVSGQDPADTDAPVLVVVAPTMGGWFTSTVVFSGTVTDVGTGVAAVEVSLDGGFTWQPATVDGTNWELTWEAPEDQEFVSYPAWVRARDQAGNSTQQPRTFSIDNVPPLGPRVEEFTAFIGPFEKDAPPGTHFDMPLILPFSGLRITWAKPFDGSGVATTLIAVDQVTDTLPTENLGVLTTTMRSLSSPGDWYVHLAARDLVGNQFIRHYGPWHVGTFADASTNFANRVQTIVVDGQIDTDLAMEEWHNIGWEWGIFEFMDDFNPTTLLDWWDPQQLFTTWDGSNLYLGWSGAWWTLDGDLWIYLNTRPGSCTQPVIPMPTCPTLPFGADYAIHITSPTEGKLWECVGDTWQQAAGVDWEFAQGEGGDTEIRLDLDMASIGELGLIAFALDDDGNPWALFPTTNSLTNLCSESFVWTDLANITIPNEGQPLGTDMLMSLNSLQAPQGAWCPGSPLQYVISLNNLEGLDVLGLALDVFATNGLGFDSVEGATCDVCPPLGDAWTLQVPSIETDASHNITITGVLSDDLSGLDTVDISATLKLFDTVLAQVNISHRVDNQAPTVNIATTPGQVIGTGQQMVAGTASDGTGSGVASVEYSVDGGNTWQQASGTINWAASLNVPTGTSTLGLLVQAADTCGYIGQATATFNVDINPPSITPELPPYLSGGSATFGGTAFDGEGQVAQVEVQFDDQTATWRRGQVYSPDQSGLQNWNYTWSLPQEDCVDHTLRVRATDSAGNTVVSGWLSVTVDNVPPTMDVTNVLAEVSLQDPGNPIVLDGTAGDGCGLSSLEVIARAPDGSSFREAAQRDGANWQYTPDLDNWVAGEYTLRVEAVDQAGNTTLKGPFQVQAVECLNPDLTATFLTAEPSDSVRIEARVSNNSGGGVPDGLSVAFYANGDPIGTAATSQMLTAGLSETVAIVWDPALSGDYDITIALNDDGAGSSPLNLCSEPTDAQQTVSILDVPLVESWNLMSAYVNPFNTDTSVVQIPIAGQYVVIQGFDGGAQSYYPDLPPAVNTLKDMDAEHGYWIKVKRAEEQGSQGAEEQRSRGAEENSPLHLSTSAPLPTLRVVGEKFAEDRAIELDAGWNLVSYLPRQPLAVAEALQSIDGQYTAVLGYDQGALSYYPDIDPSFNTLHEMEPLFGYWIKMKRAGTLTYPATVGDQVLDIGYSGSPIPNTQYPIPNATPTWVNFYGPAHLPVETIIQAIDPNGVVCGATVITHEGQYGLLACYGDDPTTPEDEGAQPGDTIQLVVDGQVLGRGIWTAHGERQWRPLGGVDLWQLYLPLVRKGS